jgi:transcriptional regulator with XRE-family HTH domain
MRFSEIGQQLRAYRLESGLRADEIAARLGVSRAALYRYEKGDVIKLDTIQRLAELLKISPLSLLGIGVEYYSRPIGYSERIRQIEETAEQILVVTGALNYLTTSDAFDRSFAAALEEMIEATDADRSALRAAADQVLGIQATRKRQFTARKPGVIAIFPANRVASFLERGIAAALPLSPRGRRIARDAAVAEMEHVAAIMEAEPIGLQFGLLISGEPSGQFELLRARDKATLAVNPFSPDANPTGSAGVTMITTADEAILPHQRIAETLWRECLKGAQAVARLRELIAQRTAE